MRIWNQDPLTSLEPQELGSTSIEMVKLLVRSSMQENLCSGTRTHFTVQIHHTYTSKIHFVEEIK